MGETRRRRPPVATTDTQDTRHKTNLLFVCLTLPQPPQTVGRFPSLDELEDIRDAALAKEGADGNNRGLLSELGRFIDSFRRM